MNDTTNLAVVDLSPYGFVFKELALQSLILDEFLSFLFFCTPGFYGEGTPHKIFQSYQVFIECAFFDFGVCSVFELLAYEGMKGTTNPAVVDLSPYGFVFKELALQTLILYEFLSFLFF